MKPFNIKKILVPIDFSKTGNNALKQAINLGNASKAKIKLVNIVVPIDTTPSDSLLPWGDTFYNKAIKNATEELRKIAKKINESNKIEIEYEVKLGSVNGEVCNMAKKEKFDLIVMGTHGTSGVKEFFAGSNAYKIVNNAVCPVLTVQKIPVRKELKSIVLPIRLEMNSRQKVDYAVKFAQLFNATVFITGYTDDKSKSKQFKVKQYVAQVEKYLTKLGVKFKSKAIFADNFTKEILNHAYKNHADLIMIMKHHDFSLEQLVKGPYAEQFVNHSIIPVLSIPVFSNPDMIKNQTFLTAGDFPY